MNYQKKLPADYLAMCSKVAKIDPKAANWLRLHAQQYCNKLNSECKKAPPRGMGGNFFTADPDLWKAFNWSKTPQGHKYWKNIADILEKETIK